MADAERSDAVVAVEWAAVAVLGIFLLGALALFYAPRSAELRLRPWTLLLTVGGQAALAVLHVVFATEVAEHLTASEMVLAWEGVLVVVILIQKAAIDAFMWRPPAGMSLHGKVVVVTGANSGIGYYSSLTFARLGATVVMACRSEKRGQEAVDKVNATIGATERSAAAASSGGKGGGGGGAASTDASATGATSRSSATGDSNPLVSSGGAKDAPLLSTPGATLMQLDLGSLESVRTFAAEFGRRHEKLHVLVNNGGMLPAEGAKTVEGLEQGFGVMHVAHHLLTQLLTPHLRAAGEAGAPARVVNVASHGHRAGAFESSLYDGDGEGDLRGEVTNPVGGGTVGRFAAYARAKYCNVVHAVELGRRWAAGGVNNLVAHSMHPGAVATNIWGGLPPGMSHFINFVAGFTYRSSEDGARVIEWLALSDDAGRKTGIYADCFCAEGTASEHATEEKIGARLWEVSERLVNLKS